MSNLKLGVEVVGAQNLLPTDGQGSSNAFVELCCDGQNFRTTIKERNLNPVWNETFYFNIADPYRLHYLAFDAYVHNTVKASDSRNFLGKVSLLGTSFVPYSDAIVLHYPLEKRGSFSRVRGEIELKFSLPHDANIKSSATELPAEVLQNKPVLVPQSKISNSNGHDKGDTKRHMFHHLPNPKQQSTSALPMMPHGEQVPP